MAPAEEPQLTDARDACAYRISTTDTVLLAPLRPPDALYDASVFLEIWEPGGRQPPNSHPASVETFLVLRGSGVAHCDEHVKALHPGQLLVLPPGSLHWIENTGTEPMYAITTMCPDAGFHALVLGGSPEPLSEAALSVVAQAATAEPALRTET